MTVPVVLGIAVINAVIVIVRISHCDRELSGVILGHWFCCLNFKTTGGKFAESFRLSFIYKLSLITLVQNLFKKMMDLFTF